MLVPAMNPIGPMKAHAAANAPPCLVPAMSPMSPMSSKGDSLLGPTNPRPWQLILRISVDHNDLRRHILWAWHARCVKKLGTAAFGYQYIQWSSQANASPPLRSCSCYWKLACDGILFLKQQLLQEIKYALPAFSIKCTTR